MKLIDKDAFIKKLWERRVKNRDFGGSPYSEYGHEDDEILSLIDTLEVKEVDLEHLEQEVQDFCERFDDRKESWYNMTPHDQKLMVSPTFANFAMQIAKHFFELGMQVSNKAQKEEEV